MQVTVTAREVLADLLFKREPVVLNGVEVGRVRGQEFLGAPGPLNELTGFRGAMETGVVPEHCLARGEGRP